MSKQNVPVYRANIKTAFDTEFFYSNMYPPNTTLNWVDTDIEKNAKSDKKIEYKFNEYGFRSDSFDDSGDINILVCGCSMTVGVGVTQEESWPHRLKQKLQQQYPHKKVCIWNIATSGASPDYVFRSISKLIYKLNPHYVCVFWPPITRLEMPYNVDPRYLTQVFLEDSNFPKDFVDTTWLSDYALAKNIVALDALLYKCKIKYISNITLGRRCFVFNDYNKNIPKDTNARDGMHPGPVWHDTVAEIFLNQINNYTY